MNTKKLYIASLRVSLSYISKGFYQNHISHKHQEYVLVKTKDMKKFKDLKTGKKYKTYFGYNNYEAIDIGSIKPFNEVIGNTKKYMTKRKALNLFEQKNMNGGVKNEENI